MEFDIKSTEQDLQVKAKMRPDQAKKMLDELAKCANGTCSCQTAEYEKLDSMQAAQTETGLTLDLKVKAGQTFDENCVNACLNHTAIHIGH